MKNSFIAFAGFAATLLYSPLTMATPTSTLIRNTYTSAYSTYFDNAEYRLVDHEEGTMASSAVVAGKGEKLSTFARSTASFGQLKNEAYVTGGPEAGIVNAGSTSMWLTKVLFWNPNLDGQKGYATLQHYYSAYFGMDYSGYSRSIATYSTGIGFSSGTMDNPYSDFNEISYRLTTERSPERHSATQEYAETNEQSTGIEWRQTAKPYGAPNNYLYLPIEFIWGQSYILFASQTAHCSVIIGDAGSGACRLDASRSAYWGGITDVRTENGESIRDFALLTADGNNVTQSLAPAEVPEPGSALLACTGLGLAWLARRRARKVQR